MFATTLLAATCWFAAAVFAVAVRHKIAEHSRFSAALAAYRLVPEPLVGWVSKGLVVLELVTLLALMLVTPIGLVFAAALFALYLGAMAINVARGRAFIDCGCGDEPTPLSMATLLRNVVLVLLSIGVFLTTDPAGLAAASIGELSLAAALVSGALALVAGLIYAASEQLLRNQATHRRLWLGVR